MISTERSHRPSELNLVRKHDPILVRNARYSLHGEIYSDNLQAMTDNIRLPDELGRQLRVQREALGLSKSKLADKAGKVREVVYRLEAGEDTTVSSLMAVIGALGLAMRLESVGLPSASEVARRFQEDDDAY